MLHSVSQSESVEHELQCDAHPYRSVSRLDSSNHGTLLKTQAALAGLPLGKEAAHKDCLSDDLPTSCLW